MICYSHGCIDDRLGDNVAFVWLSNPVDPVMHDKYGPWGNRAINENDLKFEVFKAAYPEQVEARMRWKAATWSGLGQSITKTLTAEGFGVEAEAIVRFLRAGGPTVN